MSISPALPAWRRILIHLLLAIFVANAANKFFIGDLEFELEHQFYTTIFAFEGQAPDQYRLLPLMGIKAVWAGLKTLRPATPFNHAVLVFNFFCAFLIFELWFGMLRQFAASKRLTFHLLFALLYIYTLYTGWRPDTLGLLLICVLYTSRLPTVAGKQIASWWHLLGIMALSFSRTDIAVVYGIFFAAYYARRWWIRLILILFPFATQALLQFWLFKDATYYTKPIMIWDNLGMYYLAYNPASWLIAAAVLIFWKQLLHFFRRTYATFPVFWWLVLAYLGLVFVFGRINEYRLYLPFLPLMMMMDRHLKQA